MRCPSCGQDDITVAYTECPDPDEPGEFLSFLVCKNCDNGINEHTEGECSCPKPRTRVEVDGDDVRVTLKGTYNSVFSLLTRNEANMLMIQLDRRLADGR